MAAPSPKRTAAPTRSELTPRLERPSELQVEQALERYQKALLGAQTDYFSRVRRGKNMTHASKQVLERDLQHLDAFVDAYVAGSAIESDGLLGALLKVMRNAEQTLFGDAKLPELPLDPEFNASSIRQRELILAWRDFVRKLLAARLLVALDPQHYWKSIDGDAALALADIQAGAIPTLQDSASIVELRNSMEFLRTHDSDLAAIAKRELAKLESAKDTSAKWKGGGATAVHVRDLGQVYPFAFDAIPPDLFGGGKGASRPEMHARAAAIRRLRYLEMCWDAVRDEMVKEKRIKATEFKMVVNAGSLSEGGAHPPHDTHRDGSMFDVWPVGLPHFVKGKRPGVTLTLMPPDEYEPGIDELGPTPPRREPRLQKSKDEDWTFPDASQYAKEHEGTPPAKGSVIIWAEVATRFTQCVILTYPSSMIVASRITETARDDLLERARTLRDTSNDDDRALLDRIIALIARTDPTPWTKLADERAEAVRYGHRHHWHLNYGPDRLGAEGKVPSQDAELAAEIDDVMRLTDDGLMWRMLLELPMDPESAVEEVEP